MTTRLAVLLVLVATPAFAQAPGAYESGEAENPPPPPPTLQQPAPQNEPWSNVSNINGQLVPVGEHGAYLYRFRRTNLSTNPIGWMLGFYGASLSTAVSQNLALRFDANAWSVDHGHEAGYEIGASLPIYLRRTYSGPFVEPGLVLHASKPHYVAYGAPACIDMTACSTSQPSYQTWVGPEVMVGWQWIFDSGLNVAAAFGAAKKLATSEQMNDDPEPAGYFRIGYAF